VRRRHEPRWGVGDGHRAEELAGNDEVVERAERVLCRSQRLHVAGHLLRREQRCAELGQVAESLEVLAHLVLCLHRQRGESLGLAEAVAAEAVESFADHGAQRLCRVGRGSRAVHERQEVEHQRGELRPAEQFSRVDLGPARCGDVGRACLVERRQPLGQDHVAIA
jgi:hypothetical protein